jgi:heme A synthase
MVDVVSTLHVWNMVLVLAAGTIAGVWGLILFFLKKTMNRLWRISLIVTAVVGLLQALFGIILVVLGQKPPGGNLYYLHYVYGGIVALALPVAVTYATDGKNPRRDMLIYSLAALILVAAGARALMTALGLP